MSEPGNSKNKCLSNIAIDGKNSHLEVGEPGKKGNCPALLVFTFILLNKIG